MVAGFEQKQYLKPRGRILRPFGVGMAAVFVLMAVVVGMQREPVRAATSTTVKVTTSGRVYNRSTDAGIPGMEVAITNAVTGEVQKATTNGLGIWTSDVFVQTLASIAVSSPLPSGLAGPVATTYATLGYTDVANYTTISNYPYQDVGFACHYNSVNRCQKQTYWLYDIDPDDSYNFGYVSVAPAPTPVPPTVSSLTPGATVAGPTVSATPTSSTARAVSTPAVTPLPGVKTASRGVDTTAPSTPGSLMAAVAGEGALVTLSWRAAVDDTEVRRYRLERSSDAGTWGVLADDVVGISFRDNTAAYNSRYYYRVSAEDAAGNRSGYASTEATTEVFKPSISGLVAGSFVSEDQIVRIAVPEGALSVLSDCRLVRETNVSKLKKYDRPVVAGPYRLLCKNAAGELTTSFNKPVTWSIDLTDKLGGFEKPEAVTTNSVGAVVGVSDEVFDAKVHTLHFSQAGAMTALVLASATPKFPYLLMGILVGVVLVAGGGLGLWRWVAAERAADALLTANKPVDTGVVIR